MDDHFPVDCAGAAAAGGGGDCSRDEPSPSRRWFRPSVDHRRPTIGGRVAIGFLVELTIVVPFDRCRRVQTLHSGPLGHH